MDGIDFFASRGSRFVANPRVNCDCGGVKAQAGGMVVVLMNNGIMKGRSAVKTAAAEPLMIISSFHATINRIRSRCRSCSTTRR